MASSTTEMLRAARDFLLESGTDYTAATASFVWPRPATFNFGLEWFDVLAAEHPERPALTIVEEDGGSASVGYGELSVRSDQVAMLSANRASSGRSPYLSRPTIARATSL